MALGPQPRSESEHPMTDTNAAPWLEPDDEFEGVGAHRDNPRYDPADEEPDPPS